MPYPLTAPLIEREYEGVSEYLRAPIPDASPSLGAAMFVAYTDKTWDESEVMDDSMCWSGFCVTSAATEGEAVRILNVMADRIAIALVNAERAGPDVARLLRYVRDNHPRVLPVAVVGWEDREQIRAAYAGGAEIVMRRPFTLDDLTAALLAMRNQAEERSRAERVGAEAASAPLPRRIARAVRAVRGRNTFPRTRSFLRTLGVLSVACAVSVGALSVVESARGMVGGSTDRLFTFMDRVEGYLMRDEARELTVIVPRPAAGGGNEGPSRSAPREHAR